MQERLDMAQQLGLKITSVTDGSLTTHRVVVPDLASFKKIFDAGTTAASRALRVEQMFQGLPAVGTPDSDGTANGTLRRISKYLLGNDDLSSLDAQRAAAQFPMDYTLVVGAPNGPIKGEWCLGSNGAPVSISLDSLVMEDGSYITAYATQVEFAVTSLSREGGPAPGWSDFNILGATGSTGKAVPAVAAAKQGDTGGEGSCTVSGSEPGNDGGSGSTGTEGSPGNLGNAGSLGHPSQYATLTVNKLSGATALSVFTRSGTGGAGGGGGVGGAGGTGGQGGDGKTCDCTGTSGGRGGNGGRGGYGGTGGPGGAGATATANVIFFAPPAVIQTLKTQSLPAPAGLGGPGGSPGSGGAPGGGGAGGKGHSNPGSGTYGQGGFTGATGAPGPGSGTSASIIPNTT
jgi:hypothetical protein